MNQLSFLQIPNPKDDKTLEVALKPSTKEMTPPLFPPPFPARTLPLPKVKNENREKIIKLSKEKYGRKIA